jgi:hypothetical protein
MSSQHCPVSIYTLLHSCYMWTWQLSHMEFVGVFQGNCILWRQRHFTRTACSSTKCESMDYGFYNYGSSWRCWQNISSKRCYPPMRLHCVLARTTTIWTHIAVKISNPSLYMRRSVSIRFIVFISEFQVTVTTNFLVLLHCIKVSYETVQ